jgi:hypothetical protein
MWGVSDLLEWCDKLASCHVLPLFQITYHCGLLIITFGHSFYSKNYVYIVVLFVTYVIIKVFLI